MRKNEENLNQFFFQGATPTLGEIDDDLLGWGDDDLDTTLKEVSLIFMEYIWIRFIFSTARSNIDSSNKNMNDVCNRRNCKMPELILCSKKLPFPSKL